VNGQTHISMVVKIEKFFNGYNHNGTGSSPVT